MKALDRKGLISWSFDLTFLLLTLLPGILFLSHTIELIQASATVWTLKNGVFHHFDFVSFYACGAMILHGDGGDVYDTAAQLRWYNTVISPASVPYTNFLQHVPYVFSVLPLLAMQPLREAYRMWIAISFGCGLIGAAILRLAYKQDEQDEQDKQDSQDLQAEPLKRFNYDDYINYAVLTALFMTALPSNFCFLDGQISWFYFLVLSIYCYCFLRNRPTPAGLTLALLSIKPQYLAFMALPAVLSKNKKLLVVCASAIVLLIVFAGLSLGFQNVIHYPQVLLHGEASEHFALEKPKTMISIRSIFSILWPNKAALVACLVTEFAGLAGLFYISNKLRSGTAKLNGRALLALTIVTMLVVSAHLYLYEGLLISAAALLILPSWRPSQCLASPYKYANIFLLAFPIVNLALLLGAPTLAAAILPTAVLDATADNGIAGNLFVYIGLFLYNTLIMAALLQAFIKESKQKQTDI